MNGHPDIDTTEATQHLKNILNVGKAESDAARLSSVANGNMETSSDIDVSGNYGRENSFQALFKSSETQQIILKGSEEEANFCIYGQDVTVFSSPLHHNSGRNKIKIESIVDYGWEQKYYSGKLVSIHLSGIYLAYAIRAPTTPNGLVRVMNHTTGSRALIKGLKGEVKDLAFAHSTSQVLLACVDEIGDLFVHEVVEESSKMICRKLIHVIQSSDTKPSDSHRIIWCPYIPEDIDSLEDIAESSNTDDVTTLLVVTHDEKAEMWNIDLLIKEQGTGEILPENVKNGLQVISEHKLPITAASFSPDGTALATASLDGDVKFFQVNMQEKDNSPRCLHEWTPHNGKPLSSLFFLDNHKNHNPDVQFWRFAITGADNNQELKLWSCESWTCLQTIRFLPNAEDNLQPSLKADLDLSSSYLFLSDVNRKVLYILQIHQEPSTSQACICSLSEFSVTFPVLSFAVVDVSTYKLKPSLCTDHLETEENDDRDTEAEDEMNTVERHVEGSLVKLFWIHTKSLQSCRIMYRPVVPLPLQSAGSISSLSQDSFVFRDGLSDLSMDVQEVVPKTGSESDISLDRAIGTSNISAVLTPSTSALPSAALTPLSSHLPNYKGCGEILLTPEDFTSPSHSTVPASSVSNTFTLPVVEESACGVSGQEKRSESDDVSAVPSEANVIPRRKSSQHSSASSPSREVAEILAPTKILNCDDQDDDAVEVKVKRESSSIGGLSDDKLHQKSVIQDTNSTARKQQEYRTSDWPQAPDPNKEYRIASRSDGEISLQHSAREQQLHPTRHSCKIESLHQDGSTSPDILNNETRCLLLKLDRSIESLSHKVTAMRESLHTQRQDIQDVQNEIQELHQQQKYIQSNLQNIDNLDTTISNKVEHIVAQHAKSTCNRFENLISKQEDVDQQWLDRQASALSQNVVSGINNRLDKVVKAELRNALMPHVSKFLDTVKEQLQTDISQKLTATDSVLKENLGKLAKNKAFNDGLSQSVAALLQVQIQGACKEAFQNAVIPSFEKACQNLFLQLNESFQRGTMEYLQQLDRHRQILHANIEGAVNKVQEQVNKLVVNTEAVLNTTLNKVKAHNTEAANQQDALIAKVKLVVHEEISKALREQAAVNVMRSRTVTPVPHTDPHVQQQHLMQIVKQGKLNEAFQQALSAVDVQLVLFLCESVSVEQVFGPNPCPLQQHVLLSLIHQLSGELTTQTELKVRYIEDAITSLDSTNPVTREHIGSVLGSLHQRITHFLQSSPNHKLVRNLKRILMAVQSLVNG